MFLLSLISQYNTGISTNAQSVSAIRINTGGPTQNVGGVIWSACDSSSNCNGYVTGGSRYAKSPTPSISGIVSPANQAVYQTEWTGGQTGGIPAGATAFSFNVPVTDGNYLVRLHFADSNQNAIGKRIFDVKIEGGFALQNFDIFKEANGMNKAILREFPVTISDGNVSINFIRQVENAKISGIEIIGQPSGDPVLTSTPVPTNTPLPTPAPTQNSALFVVGNSTLSAADTAVKNRLEGKGYVVTVVKDSNSSITQATGKSLVLISASVSSGAVNTKFKTTTTPIIIWEPYLYDDLGMTSSTGLGWQTNQTQLTIVKPSSPLAAGLSGTLTVSSPAKDFAWGAPSSTAEKIATTVSSSSRATIFAYDKNVTMPGLVAPARRVAFFMSNDIASLLTSDGWLLFDASVNWATSLPPVTATPSPTTAPTATPITQNTTVNWQTKAAYPLAVSEAQGAALNGRLYFFGGFNSTLQTYNQSHFYTPSTNTWTRIADMPEPLTHSPVIIDGNKLYLIGGFVGNHPGPSTVHVWIYDSATDSWALGPDLPDRRGAGAAAKIGRNIHFFGGTIREAGSNVYVDKQDHWVLNLDDQAAGWLTLPSLPTSRNHLGGIGLNGKVYAIGGQFAGAEGTANQSLVEVYDTTTGVWSTAAPMPTKRGHITSSVMEINGKIYVVGGSVDNGSGGAPTGKVEVYDPATNTWKSTNSLPVGKKTPVADVINGKIYSATGAHTSNTNYEGTITNP